MVMDLLQKENKYTMEELCQVRTDVNTLGPFRKLSGSAFDPTQAKRLRLYGYQNFLKYLMKPLTNLLP
jgi:hypothetical protein